MPYTFKVGPEAIWFILTALVTVVYQAVLSQPTAPTDWHVWAVGLGAAAVRAVIGAILHLIGNSPAGQTS